MARLPSRSLLSASSHRAQALVEFAFVLPVLLLLTLGMIDLGRAFTFGVATQQGAREAARQASRLAVNSSVTDSMVLQRLIDSSTPALQGCLPVTTTQTCGGATWTFTLAATPPGSNTSYASIPTAVTNSTNPFLSGGQITVTATGAVAMMAGWCMGQSLCLPPIGVQGQASMAFI
ncbi:MAG: pilus assembly protein [Chloroflexi bacterium]|nr:pilus assembly protein [Chloroflexota bacterium]